MSNTHAKPRYCPRCNLPMAPQNFGPMTVELCSTGCRGLWFDAGELARMGHRSKGAGPALERAVADRPTDIGLEREEVICRGCDQPMDEVSYELERTVKIDECPACDGVFLDAGELEEIRRRSLTEAEAQGIRKRRRKRAGRRHRKLKELARRSHHTSTIHLWSL